MAPQATFTPFPTYTPVPTWTPIPTPTITQTPTLTPYPTYIPRATPTLAWPTPGPSAYFRSRFLASVVDPAMPPPTAGTGSLRGRITDWRGTALSGFKVIAVGDRGQAEIAALGDGQYSLVNLPPGSYEVRLADYRSEPARSIPIIANQVSALDWVEAEPFDANAQTGPPTATPLPTATVTPIAPQIQRPAASAARPSAPEVAATQLISSAAEQLLNAFLIGVAVVALAAVATIALMRRRR